MANPSPSGGAGFLFYQADHQAAAALVGDVDAAEGGVDGGFGEGGEGAAVRRYPGGDFAEDVHFHDEAAEAGYSAEGGDEGFIADEGGGGGFAAVGQAEA